ncbi:hypothetical protein [Flammeovirga aprica]|uniref:DNA-binding transcriptional activator of the SARP family n=1 Tax=Flammeovirga aprica JL-4 TaxID=694437 RepID=A0A7X9RVW6_9BACT|nr:hypothetical protein [Flammeovirga aprica]NME69679.1 hypothetical protein [Flammeovirga aprica JL-4]
MIKIKYYISLLLIVFSTFTTYGQKDAKGLLFHETDISKDWRNFSGLEIPDKGFLNIDLQTRISIHFSTLNQFEDSFGYLIRCFDDQKTKIDLLHVPSEKNNFLLMVGDKQKAFNCKIQPYQNTVFHLVIDQVNKDISIEHENNTLATINISGLEVIEKLKLLMGLVNFKDELSYDILPMNLNSITLARNNQITHRWEFDENSGEVVNDKIRGVKGRIKNPKWTINKHSKWENVTNLNFNGRVSYTLNGNKLFVAFNEGLKIYHLRIHSQQKNFDLDEPLSIVSDTRMLYNPIKDKIGLYYLEHNVMSYFDFNKRKWETQLPPYPESEKYLHHSRSYFDGDSSFLFFGGYGHYRYQSQFIRLKDGEFKELINKEPLTPRYLSAISNSSNHQFYVLGGYGSEDGNQWNNASSIKTLSKFSLKGDTINLLQEKELQLEDNIVFCDNLIQLDTIIYALGFDSQKLNTSLSLYKISTQTLNVEKVQTSIPFTFKDINSKAELYYNQNEHTLLTVLSYYDPENRTSEVRVYKIGTPVLSHIPEISSPEKEMAWVNSTIFMLFFVAGILILIFLLVRIKGEPIEVKKEYLEVTNVQEKKDKSEPFLSLSKDKNAILTLSAFKIISNKKEVITSELSPLQKEILLLLLIKTETDNGITTEEFNLAFWPKKTTKNANNNRLVNLSKLRKTLSKLSHVTIDKKAYKWSIELEKNVFCDWKELQKILKKKVFGIEEIHQLNDLIEEGGILSNMNLEWFENYRNEIIFKLNELILNFYYHHHQNISVQNALITADVLSKLDTVSEEALIIRCRAYRNENKENLIEKSVQEYQNNFQTKFDETAVIDLKEITEGDISYFIK